MEFIQQYYTWIIPVVVLEGIIKSVALWKAARNGQLYWFISLIVLNTAGLFPLIYILFFQHTPHGKTHTLHLI